ncbi:hypothetical protein R69746_06947 [Paraburkholderia aspalathi]|uniref:head completion/stabilization protein n=1 Tax=Paraburkholderia aspalathi TaxID=1324617 RepID=UPI00190CB258|nr:head completion/stabilization protein [Paraburkholderia aspalathi]MBK3842967.1 head completion/stabilization protein [Paraburkholderia aspalathi]CAE6841553.1 hypothetical protein R69746_06947 [Paraburkholderia aspalathi]
MSSFIATAAQGTPNTAGNAATLTNDGWFPDIDLDDLREAMRLDGTVTYERIRPSTLDAMGSINAELGTWQAAQIAAGHADLESVPAPQLGGVSTQVLRYRRAVYHLVRADLTEQYRAYDSTKSGGLKAEDLEHTIGESRRNARWAVNDIQGLRRSTVELI